MCLGGRNKTQKGIEGRWRASLNHGNGKCPQDLKRDAIAAWRRFVSCVQALPPDQATALWQIAHTEAELAIGP
jgi:hypothetical protein